MKCISTIFNFQKLSTSLSLIFFFLSLSMPIIGQVTTIFNEDWEGNWISDWHVDAGTWEVGTPTIGPDSAFNGSSCAATVLNGNYSEPVDTRLIRHTSFIVPSASENPRFRFWYWFSFSHSDWGEVQIKTSNGVWESISIVMNNYGSDAWSYGSVDIADYADSTVQIAFNFHSADAGIPGGPDVSSGWYIDDVSLITGPYLLESPEDFESGFGDWSVDEGSWEIGNPTNGPSNAHSGQNCVGTNLEGNYQEPADSRLVSPQFIVPSASENPRFRFWYWFSFSHSDWGEVQIKTSNGVWESISIVMNNYGSDAWSYGSVDIADYADSTVQIAFNFHSADAGIPGGPDVSSGWYIDDISLITGPYLLESPEDFESGFGDWSVDEGSWEIGNPTNGPSNAHSGQNCVGTNLEGNYQEPADSRLVSPQFIVPSASENPSVQFWHWFSFSHSDWGEVQLTSNGGENWVTISSQFLNTSSGIWTPFFISLSSYADSTVQIAFNFHSADAGIPGGPDVSSGWYIDDIDISAVIVSINDKLEDTTPKQFHLSQNYPNPFNPSTIINYQLTNAGFVTLKIYDVIGNEVATLVNEEKPAGSYESEFDANKFSSGVYFYRLLKGNPSSGSGQGFVETKKMILLK